MAEEVQSSERVNKVETPLEKDLARIGESFDSFKTDLIASGVSEETITITREHALARKRTEHEERQKQDPFVLIANALTDAAQSEEERALANFEIRSNEYYRNDWQKQFHEAQIAHSRSGQGELDLHTFLWTSRKIAESPDRKAGVVVISVRSKKALELPGNEEDLIIPSQQFQERILINLGVLKPGENFDTLRAIPGKPQEPDVPYNSGMRLLIDPGSTVNNLPTNIDGVKARVVFDQKYPQMTVSLDESAFGKVLNNTPTSSVKPV